MNFLKYGQQYSDIAQISNHFPPIDQQPFTNNPQGYLGVSRTQSGHWTQKENVKFEEQFSEKESRRNWKVFKCLSEFIKTRDPNQCRSHHYKMKKNFRNIGEILAYLQTKEFGIQKKSQKYQQHLKNKDFNDFGKIVDPNPSNKYFSSLPFCPENSPDLPPHPKQQPAASPPHQPQKIQDIAYKKTNDGYIQNPFHQKTDIIQNSFLPHHAFGFDHNFQGFPSTNLLFQRGLKNNQNIEEVHRNQKRELRTKKIIQCQYYFRLWLKTVESLVVGEGGEGWNGR